MNSIKRTFGTAAGLLGLVAIFALPAAADQQILDDLIVDGSACIGQDCVNGESFGFDTLRLKENNLRIHFQDTSNSASFPTSDWRIRINDSSNGGGNYFAVEDSDLGRTPFRVDAGAKTNALRVSSSSRVGLGTGTPVVELHVVDGDTPTLRLEQDGSSGFTPQTWDVAGNESNFFVRDATNGSRLVFRVQPGAPDASIYIKANGDIGSGVGTNPEEELHVRRTVNSGNVTIKAQSTEARQTRLILQNSVEEWRVVNGTLGDFAINSQIGGASTEFVLTPTGNLTIAGTLTTAGSCSIGCDAVFSPEYEVEPIKEHAASMWQNRYLPAVGPTPEDGPFNLTEKTGGMLNELEKAHIYIEQLHDRLAKVEELLAASEAGKNVE